METGDILRKMHDTLLHRPMNFSFIDDYVGASARFMSKRSVEWARQKGIRAILSLTERPIPESWLVRQEIDYLNVPIANHHAPTQYQLKLCVEFISRNIDLGNKVLLHCAAGKGRTGTVLAAYVCSRYGISAEAAIAQMRQKRKGSVEKDPGVGQEASVLEFANGLAERK